MNQPTPYPPGGPVFSEQIQAQPAAPPAGPVQVDPAMVAAVAAHIAAQQPQPAPVAAPIPKPAPAPVRKAVRRPPKAADGVTDDFDAMWAEKRAKAPHIKALGRTFVLPPVMPARAVLYVESNRHRMSGNIGTGEAIEIMTALIGKRHLDELLDEGLGIDELFDLIRHCMDVYNFGEDEGEAEAEEDPTSSA